MKIPLKTDFGSAKSGLAYGIFYCVTCCARAQLKLIGQYSYLPNPDEREEIHILFGSCVACFQPGLVSKLQVGEHDFNERAQFYPPIPVGENLSYEVPALVRESYIEAKRCASVEAWLATAVMIRRTLEAVVKNFDSKVKNVHAGLQKMKENGTISEEFLTWGNELRLIGNSGAHVTERKVSAQDATEALDFATAIIETLYHLRPKFEALRTRRQCTANTHGTPNEGEAEKEDES